MYWDEERDPSVETRLGGLFASAFGEYEQISSLAIGVNPRWGLNSYWQMPFRKWARVTIETLDHTDLHMAYHLDNALQPTPTDAA